MSTRISLATKLSLVALGVTLLSLAVTATVGLLRGGELAEDVVNARLTTLASARSELVELFVESIEHQVEAMAASPATVEAIGILGDAVDELAAVAPSSAMTDRLTQHYLSTVVPELERVRGSTDGGAAFLVPDGSAVVALQTAYTIPTTSEDGTTIAPELVSNPGDGSTYSEHHPSVHEAFGQVAISSGFDDLLLIDARNDVVVYSMRKRIDFGTNLDLGPHSGSALARAVDHLAVSPEDGVWVSGFSRYVPAVEQPTVFVTSPVFDGSRLVGYLAVALTVERFDEVLSGNGWSAFGDSGEAYLVDADATMVSTSRWFGESRSAFLSDSSETSPQLTEAQRRRISATGTTATVQSVDRKLVVAADEGPGITSSINYLGNEVRTAYERLDIPNVGWTMIVDAETEELDQSITTYVRDMLFAVALFVVLVTFVVVRWSNHVVAPIRAIATRLRAAQRPGSDRDAMLTLTTDGGPAEYVDLSTEVDQMLHRLDRREHAVRERGRERRVLLSRFLPAAIARRSEDVGGEVLDHVRLASVVIVEMRGLGELVGTLEPSELRDLMGEIVDEVDALAADLGLERVKLVASRYYAVCGVSRPLLDHAPRSVGFGLRARELVSELSGNRLGVRVGVAEGPVSVGLAESATLVYDAWGETVSAAERLVEQAPNDTVLVTGAVRSHLSEEFVAGGDPSDAAVAVNFGAATEGGSS